MNKFSILEIEIEYSLLPVVTYPCFSNCRDMKDRQFREAL